MKRIVSFLLISALLLASCAKEEFMNESSSDTVKVRAVVEDFETDTKAAVSDKGVFTWQAGDMITVYNNPSQGSSLTSSPLTMGGSNTAEFEFSSEWTEAYNIGFYPSDIQYNGKITIPEKRKYFAEKATPTMMASYEAGAYKFKHLGAVVKVQIENVPIVEEGRFEFKTPGYRISGVFSLMNNNYISTDPTENELDQTYNLTIVNRKENATMTFYVPIPTGYYEHGFTISLLDRNDNVLFSKEGSTPQKVGLKQLLIMPTLTYSSADASYAAAIGEEKYKTLADAIEKVEDKGTITILRDITDATGLVIDTEKTFTIDFDEHTYTLNPGEESTGFQIMAGQNVTFMNGTINCSEKNKDNAEGINMMIQNFADDTKVDMGDMLTSMIPGLSLDNMIIDGTNIAHPDKNASHIVSNSGNAEFIGSTTIIAQEGDIAFDLSKDDPDVRPCIIWSSVGDVVGGIELNGAEEIENEEVIKPILEIAGGSVLKLTEPIKVASNSSSISVGMGGKIIPSEKWNVEYDALVVVKRNAKLYAFGYDNGMIDTGNTGQVKSAIMVTEPGDEKTTGTASLDINGLIVNGYHYGIRGNENCDDTYIRIYEGKISATCENFGSAIYHPQYGELNLTFGEYTGYNSAVELHAGKLYICAGTFTSTCSNETSVKQKDGSSYIEGAAIAFLPRVMTAEDRIELQTQDIDDKIGIFGGTSAIYETYIHDGDISAENFSLWFGGGISHGKVYCENARGFINGGRFDEEPDAKYIAQGLTIQEVEGFFEIINQN